MMLPKNSRLMFFIGEMLEADIPKEASALTYTTLLAIVPLLFVIFNLLTLFPWFSVIQDDVKGFIFHNMVPNSGNTISHYFSDFLNRTQGLSVISIAFLAVTVCFLFLNIENAFNRIWHVKRKHRDLLNLFTYWLVIGLAPFLIGLSLVASSFLFSLRLVSEFAEFLHVGSVLPYLVPIGLSVSGFTAMYILVPNTKIHFKSAFLAACIATFLFEIAKFSFGLYMTYFPSYQLIYGALATIPIFLVWLYISWWVTLFGALICRLLQQNQGCVKPV